MPRTLSTLTNRVGIPTKINDSNRKGEQTMTTFAIQNPLSCDRSCSIDIDTDRSTCCGSEIVYHERDWDNPMLGGYDGCECCGAVVDPTIHLSVRDETVITDMWLAEYGDEFSGRLTSHDAKMSHLRFRAAVANEMYAI